MAKKNKFEEGFHRPTNLSYVIQNVVEAIETSSLKTTTKLDAWKRPRDGWVKLNGDEECKELGATAGCSGLF
jgi:hypothetical protein